MFDVLSILFLIIGSTIFLFILYAVVSYAIKNGIKGAFEEMKEDPPIIIVEYRKAVPSTDTETAAENKDEP